MNFNPSTFGNFVQGTATAPSVPQIFDATILYLDVFTYPTDPLSGGVPTIPPEKMMTLCRVNDKVWFVRNNVDPNSNPQECFIVQSAIIKQMVALEVISSKAAGDYIWLNCIGKYYRVRYRVGQTVIQDRYASSNVANDDPEKAKIFEKMALVISETVQMYIRVPFSDGFNLVP